LPIGARAPSFVLQDQEGRALALESLLEEGPVALVFFRSAGW
jgi:peroxiredoxin